MRRVEVARYYLPPGPGAGPRAKPYPSRWKMTADDAAQRGATGIVPGTTELREVPHTQEETAKAMVQYQSAGRDSVKGPAR